MGPDLSTDKLFVQRLLSLCYDGGRSKRRCDRDRWVTVSALCHSLERMCQKNSTLRKTGNTWSTSRFYAPNVSPIPLAGYLKRIALLFECSKECFVIALEYIHRLIRVCQVNVDYNTVRQVAVAALRVSNKFFDDKETKNSYFAHIVDLPAKTIFMFEAQLLFFLKFDLSVLPEKYLARYKTMLAENRGPTKVELRPRIE